MRWGLACVGVVLAACGTTAAAAEPDGYVGASVGESRLKAEYAADGLTASIDRTERSYKVFAGARFGLFGLEGGYIDFGHPTVTAGGTGLDLNLRGFLAYGTLNVPLGPALLFAKAGVLNWSADVELDGLSANESGTEAAYGAGASFRLTEHLSARAEYEKFEAGSVNDFHFWSAGLELTF